MAVISATISAIPGQGNIAGYKVVWSALLTSPINTGSVIQIPDFSDRSVQISGTMGSGGTIVIEGTNDGVTFNTLSDANGNALSKTVTGIFAITEATIGIRPQVTVGDATTSCTVAAYFRKTAQP